MDKNEHTQEVESLPKTDKDLPTQNQNDIPEQRESYEKTNRLGTDSIPRLLFSFGIPSVMALIVNASHPLINSVFLGRGVGDVGLAAMTVVFPSAIMILAFTVLIGSGGNALMAMKFGEKKHKEAERVMGNSFLLMVAFSLVFTALGLIFHKDILIISGASSETLPYAMAYQEIIFSGMIFNCIGFGMVNFMRTTGAPVRAMVVMMAGAFTNIVLDYFFVLEFNWGMRGAGFATLFANMLVAILVLQYFLSSRSPVHFHFSTMKPDIKLIGNILYLGLSSFVMQVASVFVNIAINSTLIRHGAANPTIGVEGALAGMGVVMRVAQMAVIPVMGFVTALQPIVGYNFGARQIPRVSKALWTTIAIVTAIHGSFWLIIQFFPATIIGIFGISEANVVAFATTALRLASLMLPVIGFQMVTASFFQSTGQPKIASVLTLARQVLILLPLIIYGPQLLQFFGLSGDLLLYAIPAAMSASDFLTALLAAILLRRGLKLMRKADESGDFSKYGGIENPSAA